MTLADEPKFTDKEFEAVKTRAETQYVNIDEVRCPFLATKVLFNAKGWDHLTMKRWNHARSRHDQYGRLRLLHLVPDVLKKSHTLQGLDEGNRLERIRVRGKWEQRMVFVTYYEFISVIKGCRIRVVVKKINNDQPYFWSIIPYWKQNEYRKKMFEGNPEED